jgi:hypothetical protein
MKIQTDQLTPTQDAGKVQKVQSVPASNFGDFLAREVDSSQQAAPAASLPPLQGVSSLAQTVAAQAVSATTGVSSGSQAVMDNVDSILNQWEKYSGQLAQGGTTQLRQAYGTLEDIQAGVKKLKEENPDLDGQSPQLSSLVNELDVMTTTEQIKFNRGDYL